MADVIKRKTKKGVRYYARGFIELNPDGTVRRTCKLILVNGEGVPITNMALANAEAERLEDEAEKRSYRIKNNIPEPKPPEPAKAPLTLAQLIDKFLKEYQGERVKDRDDYIQDARSLLGKHVKPALGRWPAAEIPKT